MSGLPHVWLLTLLSALLEGHPKLCKESKDANNLGGWLIMKDLLNEWVAEGVATDPHDFTEKLES